MTDPCPGCPDCRPCERCEGSGRIIERLPKLPGAVEAFPVDKPCSRCHGTGVEPPTPEGTPNIAHTAHGSSRRPVGHMSPAPAAADPNMMAESGTDDSAPDADGCPKEPGGNAGEEWARASGGEGSTPSPVAAADQGEDERWTIWRVPHLADVISGPDTPVGGIEVVPLSALVAFQEKLREAEERLRDMGARGGAIREGYCAFCGWGAKPGASDDPDEHTFSCLVGQLLAAESKLAEVEALKMSDADRDMLLAEYRQLEAQQHDIEQIVRLALDFGEDWIGHDGTIKLDADQVSRFAHWVIGQPVLHTATYRHYRDPPEAVPIPDMKGPDMEAITQSPDQAEVKRWTIWNGRYARDGYVEGPVTEEIEVVPEAQVERLREALSATMELAAVSVEGDPWYAEQAGIDAAAILAQARIVLGESG